MLDTILNLAVFAAYLAFSAKRLLTYVHMLQQDDYDGLRLLRWIIRYRVFDKRLSAVMLLLGGLWVVLPFYVTDLLLIAAFGGAAWIERDPRKASKKKLVITDRVKRLLLTALALAALFGLWSFSAPLPWLWIITIQLVPLALIFANILLMPYEAFVQKRFWDEAHRKLLSCGPTVIGVTGSFGKTSVKHILGHILKTQAPTLITPGSVNTPMGITRIIREQLEENHRYFVAEMGAYGPGSIARLCRLAPPDIGVIVAIGQAHYERFKSLETVAQAKYELAEAVIAKDGKVIVHDSTLAFPHTAQMKDAHPKSFVVCGESNKDGIYIRRIEQQDHGLRVEVMWKDTTYILEAPLYGLHHGSNIALAFAAAVSLGIAPDNIQTALRSTPQIAHRLEVKRQADGTTIIDDAFNSNPAGFRAALEILRTLGANGRKILITPGMVELGDAHDKEHYAIGRLAAETCDVVIAINPNRIRDFTRGFKEVKDHGKLIEMNMFAEAAAWLDQNRQAGDVILIENDLPDLYERVPKI